jgi:YVTN family beta-propeller protein
LIYATVPALNEVAVINPSNPPTVQTTIPIGSTPSGICISPDGSTVYVADSGSDFVGVINTATQTAGSPIFLGSGNAPTDIQMGTNGRLWVIVGGSVAQFTTTGASAGPSVGANGGVGFFLGGSAIKTSSDQKTLYVAEYGNSPSYLYKYDVSGTNPVGLIQIASGGNGEDLALSNNDSLVVATDGGGNDAAPGPYQDAVFRSSDFAMLGALPVGAYPGAFAFSPDNVVGYAGTHFSSPNIQIYSLGTYLETGTITAAGDPQKLFVDQSGKYLFADIGSTTEVFGTGRVAPEPGSLALAAIGMLALRRRKIRAV